MDLQEIVRFIGAYPLWAKAAMVAFAAGIVAVAIFAKPKLDEKAPSASEPQSMSAPQNPQSTPLSIGTVHGNVVVSQNQQGAVTAHTVNVVNPRIERHLDDRLRGQLDTLAREQKDLVLHVLVVSGSGDEATAFATEIKHYLDRIGAKTKGVDVGMFGNPEVSEGTHVFKEGGGINIIIGRAPLK